jgi:hypothetical protein
MSSKFFTVLEIFLLAAILIGCSDKSDQSKNQPGNAAPAPDTNVATGGDGDAGSKTTADSGTTPDKRSTSDSDVQTLLTIYCARCHTGAIAADDVLLSTTDEAKAFASRSATSVETSDMPPRSSRKIPTDAERAQLVEWFRHQE